MGDRGVADDRLSTAHTAGRPRAGGRPALRWWLIAGVVATVCALPMVAFGPGFEAWAERAIDAMTSTSGIGALVLSLLALDTMLPVPSSIVATVASQRLGFAGGTIVIALGLCIGNAIGYLIGRTFATPLVEALVGAKEVARARTIVTTRPGILALALTRPVPIISEAVVVLAGTARTPLARTAAVCGLANLGLAMAYAAIGSGADGSAAFPLVVVGSVGVPAVGLAAAALVARRRQHMQQEMGRPAVRG